MTLYQVNLRRRGHARGISLIEVLVAILVVSFGVLAMAGLLGNAARYGKTSEYRSVATLLASDIGDRMRANMPALATNPPPGTNPPGSSTAYDITNKWVVDGDPPPLPRACDTNCTPAQMAELDKAEWQRAVHFALPSGMGYLIYNPTERSADVWVAWLDPTASRDEVKFDEGPESKECPPDFKVGKEEDRPRCLFFRIGL